MREMKLSIMGISKGDKNVKAFANIDFISCILGMDMSTPCCRLDVSVPYKEGNTLEQYESELTAKAKERITELYKEIVCGSEMDDEIVLGIQGKCTSGYSVKVIRKNGKLQVSTKPFVNDVTINSGSSAPSLQELAERIESLEKTMGNSAGVEALQSAYNIARKAAEEFFKRDKSNGGCL